MIDLKTILLAEDNPKDVELTREAMAENNLANNLAVVNDGVEVMEYLRCEGKYKSRKEGNPAFILLDIKMPRMDGMEATRIIKSFRSDLPVIAVTAFAMAKEREFILAAGCDDYLPKPLKLENLISIIQKHLQSWQVQ